MVGITSEPPKHVAALAADVERLRRLTDDVGRTAADAKASADLVVGQLGVVRGEVAALGALRAHVWCWRSG